MSCALRTTGPGLAPGFGRQIRFLDSGAIMPVAVAALAVVSLIVLPTVADAQSQRSWPPQHRRERPQLALEASGFFSTQRGEPLGAVGDGSGFDVMGSIGSGMFSLGGGYQYQTHRRLTSGSAVVDGAFIEPRIAMPLAVGNFTPYVFARGARLTRRVHDTAIGDEERTVSGTAVGGGFGTLFWLAPNIQLNTSLLWQDMRFDRASQLPILSNSRAEGSQWGLRAGLTLGFDNWGR